MKPSPNEMLVVLEKALLGLARQQARQEMLECIVRALIVETPPAHPLFAKALRTAKSDLDQRSNRSRAENPPEVDASAMALWNELWKACQPPEASAPPAP